MPELAVFAQTERARRVAVQLEEDGHVVGVLDLLDALASVGLRLSEDSMGVASEAYVAVIAEREAA